MECLIFEVAFSFIVVFIYSISFILFALFMVCVCFHGGREYRSVVRHISGSKLLFKSIAYNNAPPKNQ